MRHRERTGESAYPIRLGRKSTREVCENCAIMRDINDQCSSTNCHATRGKPKKGTPKRSGRSANRIPTRFGPPTEMSIARMLPSMGPTLAISVQSSPNSECGERPATALAIQHLFFSRVVLRYYDVGALLKLHTSLIQIRKSTMRRLRSMLGVGIIKGLGR